MEMSGFSSVFGALIGFSMVNGGLSYLDSAGTCAMCKAKGLDKNENGEGLCEACPYYETSLLMPEEEEEADDNHSAEGTETD